MTDAVAPPLQLMWLLSGFAPSRAIAVVAELGVADELAEGPRSTEELAENLHVRAEALYRLLRALSSLGVFEERDGRVFALTPLGALLRSGHEDSLRAYARFASHESLWAAWLRLPAVLETGEPSFEAANGADFWGFTKASPAFGRNFDASMAQFSKAEIRAVCSSFDFGNFPSVCDVGGGRGQLLQQILVRWPSLRGALFELPDVAVQAQEQLEQAGLTNRSEVIAGSFFEPLPRGFDLYVMKHVLHDWSDAQARHILSRCREAIAETGTLLLLEGLVEGKNVSDPLKWMDLHMMVSFGGLERTRAQWEALLGSVGLQLVRVTRTPSLVHALEVRSDD